MIRSCKAAASLDEIVQRESQNRRTGRVEYTAWSVRDPM
jgi:hypothetical protein